MRTGGKINMNKNSKKYILLKLFFTTIYISTFTFGGGFVIITFMKKKFVDELHWIDEEEMLDLTAIAQSSPGAIAVNAAILVGWKTGGLPGMVVAVIGTIIPPMVILTIISFFYVAFATNTYIALILKGMQAGVAAVILDVVCSLGANVIKQKNWIHYNISLRRSHYSGRRTEERKCIMIYLQMFLSFLQVGMFSIGGGYAAMPLIQNQVVTSHNWLTMNEFTDLITIAEMTPGPIAVNSATFVGVRIAGIPGALIATFGCILPSCLIVSILAYVYFRYKNMSGLQCVLASLRPAVVALIASAGLSILELVVFQGKSIDLTHINWIGVILFLVAFIVLRKWKCNPILVMCCCGIIGLGMNLLLI